MQEEDLKMRERLRGELKEMEELSEYNGRERMGDHNLTEIGKWQIEDFSSD